MFAFIVYSPMSTLSLLILPIPVPAPIFALLYLAYSWWQARQNGGRVNHDAHLGGAVVGLLFVLVTDPAAFAHFFEALPYSSDSPGVATHRQAAKTALFAAGNEGECIEKIVRRRFFPVN